MVLLRLQELDVLGEPHPALLRRKLNFCIAQEFVGTEVGAGAVRVWVKRLMVWMAQRSGLSLASLGTSPS